MYVIWNSVTSTDSTKLERIQRKFAALCYTFFHNDISTLNTLDGSNFLLSPHDRSFCSLLFFSLMLLKEILLALTFFYSVTLRIPSVSVLDYSTFSAHRNFKANPSATCFYCQCNL
jgi:hypothetical protein